MNKKLDKIFKNSKRLPIDNSTKIVIMSDCHRGAGDNYDNFIKNKNIYAEALKYYYKQGFTYIELGDGDDMWEVKKYHDIIKEHLDSFKLIKKFHDDNRLIMFYGNHDICKKYTSVLEKNFYKYYDNITKQDEYLLNDLEIQESLILNYDSYDLFLLHGHQADFLNSTLWRFSRFLVRYVWKNLERIGIKDPTGAAKNYNVSKKTEKNLQQWSAKNNKILIAGHTHRPIYPKIGESLYFNDGSCIHPSGITCLEIDDGNITLVKWEFITKSNKSVSVGRKVLEGSEKIVNFFK